MKADLHAEACTALIWLTQDCKAHENRAVCAGALDVITPEKLQMYPNGDAKSNHQLLIKRLRAAAKRHDDAANCEHAALCKRCAALRARGERCALPGCGARKREGDAKKALLLCGACRGAAYCGPAHQRADWARHKPACRQAAEEGDEDA
jgi:hypothetical protein